MIKKGVQVDNLKRLQNLILKIIIFLVWFGLMCFTLILAGNIFHWSLLTENFEKVFFTLFGISLGTLAALVLLHVVLTMNRISDSISRIAGKPEADPGVAAREGIRFRNLVVLALAGILVVVVFQGALEYRVARHRVQSVEKQIAEIARSTLSARITRLIEEDGKVNELYFARDEMLLSLEEKTRGVTLLIPRKGASVPVFYMVTPYDYDRGDERKISDSLKSRNLFIPDQGEKNKFNEMLGSMKPFTRVYENGIRSFCPVAGNEKPGFVLLLDTGRKVSNEYLSMRMSK